MTKKEQQAAERQQAIESLCAVLKPGDVVYTILRHVSRSGMQREISLKIADTGGEISDITCAAAKAMNDRVGKRDGIVVGGCGMDMGFALVHNLSYVLWPHGFGCVGVACGSSDHANGDRDRTPHSVWDENGVPENREPYSGEAADGCKRHWHNNGGYALQHKWL